MTTFSAHGQISKVDDEKRQVFGWASITDLNGEPVVDRQNDWVDAEELEKAVYDYVLKSRIGGTMHERVGKSKPKATSELIESIVITPEKIEKMGLPEGSLPLGWWAGFQVRDEDTWKDVKKGKLKSFSIHGMGKRHKVSKDSLRKVKKRREDQLAEIFKHCGHDEHLFAKSIAFLADVANEMNHPDAPFYSEVAKHMAIGIHKAKQVDGYTRSDGTQVSGYTRSGSRRRSYRDDDDSTEPIGRLRGGGFGAAIGGGIGSTVGPLGLISGAGVGGLLGSYLGGRERAPLPLRSDKPKKAESVFEKDGEKFITLSDGTVVPVDDDDRKHEFKAGWAATLHNMAEAADTEEDRSDLSAAAREATEELPPLWRKAANKEIEIQDKERLGKRLQKNTKVEGYTRSDGTKVESHTRGGAAARGAARGAVEGGAAGATAGAVDAALDARRVGGNPRAAAMLRASRWGPAGAALGAAGYGIHRFMQADQDQGAPQGDDDEFITLPDGTVIPIDSSQGKTKARIQEEQEGRGLLEIGSEEFGMSQDELIDYMGRTGSTDLDDVRSNLRREGRLDKRQPRLSDRDKERISKLVGLPKSADDH